MGTKEFQDYYKTVEKLDFKKTIKHGHGGYLEKTFEDFLVKSGAKGPLEFDANGRYQEGKEKLADIERKLGLNTEFNDGMDLGHVPELIF